MSYILCHFLYFSKDDINAYCITPNVEILKKLLQK